MKRWCAGLVLVAAMGCGKPPPESAPAPAPAPVPEKGATSSPTCSRFSVLSKTLRQTRAERSVAAAMTFDLVDTDGDGIPNEYDLCPWSAEDGLGDHPFDGCADKDDPARLRPRWPALPKRRVTADRIEIDQPIHFATDSATIEDDSRPVLAAMEEALRAHPEIELLEVAGHADKRGDEAKNLALTKARAAKVVEALRASGIDPKILRPAGYGFYCLLDPHDNDAAYAKNRRVELVILRRAGKDIGKWGGCAEAEKHGLHPEPLPPPSPRHDQPAKAGPPEAHYCGGTQCEKECLASPPDTCHDAVRWSDPDLNRSLPLEESIAGALRLCKAKVEEACDLYTRPQYPGALKGQFYALFEEQCRTDGVSCGPIAAAHLTGCGVSQDTAKGVAEAKRGCASGSWEACLNLGYALWEGRGAPPDHGAAFTSLSRACELTLADPGWLLHTEACDALAEAAGSEPALAGDKAKLKDLLLTACDWPDDDRKPCALTGVAALSIPRYESPRACALGDYASCYANCKAFVYSSHPLPYAQIPAGTPNGDVCLDLAQARAYGKSSFGGKPHSPGSYTRGTYYPYVSAPAASWDGVIEEGSLIGKHGADYDARAFNRYREGCTAGYLPGCVNAERLRLEGRGTYRDEATALPVLAQACDKGVAIACALRADALLSGHGAGQSAAEGARLLERACKGGIKPACQRRK
jgi:outer membrane protein OmpA-like peptidoglycan-associated protein/TPR repeat protein